MMQFRNIAQQVAWRRPPSRNSGADSGESRAREGKTGGKTKKKTAACGLGHGCLERSDKPRKVHLGMILVHSAELATEVVPGTATFAGKAIKCDVFRRKYYTHSQPKSGWSLDLDS